MATTPKWGFVGKDLLPIEQAEKLKEERDLSNEVIDALGIEILGAQGLAAELGKPQGTGAIKLPYWGLTGEPVIDDRGGQMIRYRYTGVVNDKRTGKPQRYTQRAGTGSRHYLPRLDGLNWLDVAKDPSVPLFYTEGEFKSIAGCRHLGPTVANAGVTSWGSKMVGGLAAPLNDFDFRGRTVYICYDAEATSSSRVPLKVNILRALGELAVDLRVRGATVRQLLIARTPIFKEGAKLGLDDYFKAGGTAEALLATAEEPQLDEDWVRLFETYAIFQGTKPHVKNIKTGDVYTGKEFSDYIERKSLIREGKSVKLATLYREHEDANVFNKYVFDPQLPPGYLRDEQLFNTWQGFAIEPSQSDNYERHVNDYLSFTRGVWGEENAHYFLDWASQIFQRPGELTTISPILVSRVKGIGKSLTGAVIRSLIGPRGAFVGSIEGLTEKHTGELEGKLFTQVDEADALFGSKENKLKELDSDEIRIRKMNTDGYTIRNILRKFYTTNENAAFRIAADERRYWVVRSPRTHDDGLPGAQWNSWLRETIVPMLKDPEALGDLMHFFMQRDITKWDSTRPVPRTPDMMDMVEAGETKKDTMAQEIYEALSEDGVWATDSLIAGVDKKMWAEIKSITKDNGGMVVTHAFMDTKTVRCQIYMTRGHELKTIADGITGRKLDKGQLGNKECRDLLLKTRKVMDSVRQSVSADKF